MPADPAVALAETLDLSCIKRVNRAMAALRRHEMAVVDGGDDAVLALAVETVTPEDLDTLRRLSGGAPAMVLTGRRAAILGLAGAGGRATLVT
ncbi:MAG TPA: GTP cyclohydrolase II, partial [Azospirillaceae bacterium]|nr:GTP cyclohydrolase II [Azospirillaceae bacterium]